jgi:hypothetical protein
MFLLQNVLAAAAKIRRSSLIECPLNARLETGGELSFFLSAAKMGCLHLATLVYGAALHGRMRADCIPRHEHLPLSFQQVGRAPHSALIQLDFSAAAPGAGGGGDGGGGWGGLLGLGGRGGGAGGGGGPPPGVRVATVKGAAEGELGGTSFPCRLK